MSTAPQITFGETAGFFSPAASRNHFQLLTALTAQAAKDIDLCALIEGFVDSVGRAFRCDCACIALLDPEDSRAFREFVFQYPHQDRRVQQSIISKEEAQRLSKILELARTVSLAGVESVSHAVAGLNGFKTQYHFPLVNRGSALGVLTLAFSTEGTFRQAEVTFLEQVAVHIAIGIANARAHDQMAAAKEHLKYQRVFVEDESFTGAKFEEIVGSSEPLLHALGHVARVAPTDSTVLITGESGTGKELIARAIHKRSRRASGPFIRVNCAAIPQSLIASELFGHEKGAFTGATERRLGRFELANGGTIFLDEIGDIPADTQVALLRVLQERELERVGGRHTIAVDVRVIAATNRDLKMAVQAGTFRLDLFYRLNVFPVHVPSLRERKDDIPLLAQAFLDGFSKSFGLPRVGVTRRAKDALLAYHWPGNVRELRNILERGVILSECGLIDLCHLSLDTSPAVSNPSATSTDLSVVERETIRRVMLECKGNKSRAAKRLGLSRTQLYVRLQKHGIETEPLRL